MTTPGHPARARSTGFTLIEVLVALAIMAVGVTAAIALLTAATTMHKRAIDLTNAALVADAALAEVRGAVTLSFDPKPLAVHRPGTADAPPVLIWKKDATNADYKGYVYDLLLTPIGTIEPDAADAFLAEVKVRWKSAAQSRTMEFKTVVLRKVAVRDLK
jgi:prepilin-type N-terminal cleavage/methylation domain-containing protein